MVIEYDYALQSRQTNVRLQHAEPPAHVEEALLLPGKAHRFLLEMLSLHLCSWKQLVACRLNRFDSYRTNLQLVMPSGMFSPRAEPQVELP